MSPTGAPASPLHCVHGRKCVRPTGPLLARGAWAVVWREGDGWREVTGTCAELQAVHWGATAPAAPAVIVTDSEYVVNGVVAMLAEAIAPLLAGPHGDL